MTFVCQNSVILKLNPYFCGLVTMQIIDKKI